MYMKPTEEQINYAISAGWSKAEAERGYAIMVREGMLEVCRIDCEWVGWGENGTTDIDDEDCAHEAERLGICKIIPVDELPANFEYRYFGWVDTPKNRTAIKAFCENN